MRETFRLTHDMLKPGMTVMVDVSFFGHPDLPICEEQYQIPFGQYSVELDFDIPVCAAFGRLDRRHNLGYYTTGYCAV